MIQSCVALSSGFVMGTLRHGENQPDPGMGEVDAACPLGLYVHFPFCGALCPYCDFAVDVRADIPHEKYADTVCAELVARAVWFVSPHGTSRMHSVYFGGGTPGLWRPASLARVLNTAREAFGLKEWGEREVTVEVNPGEVQQDHLWALREAGVNRLSMGVQSFDDGLLQRLGRNHDAACAPRAFVAARAAGFDNISCDLMFGVPGQSMEQWQSSVQSLVELGPEHISAYALAVERGTKFGALDRAGRLPRPDDDAVAAMFVWGRDALAAAGYAHYEVSSYARPGRRAVHNGLYWAQGAYLGVGAGAASFRPLRDGTGWRWTNPRATDTYFRRAAQGSGNPAPALVEKRTLDDLEKEALWLGLRTVDGVERVAHRRRFGRDPVGEGDRAAASQKCVQAGWLEVSEKTLRLTAEGFLFADEVAARLWA